MVMLAGDVGATKTVLGLFETGPPRPIMICSNVYPSKSYDSLESIILEFLSGHGAPSVKSACFGVPGPVLGARCVTTNLDWVVSSRDLVNLLGTSRVVLVNDLVATAMAAPRLNDDEVKILNTGRPDETGALGIVAPGTGLGVALMIWTGSSYQPIASEGGHVDFAPTDEEQVLLLRYMLKRFPRVSVERLASGPGLLEIFNWMSAENRLTDDVFHKEINSSPNPAGLITKGAIESGNPICDRVLDIYVSILGSVCGNLALTAMTTGGIFLGGGVSPKILPRLLDAKFLEAFTNKGRFTELIQSIPVKIILNDRAALIGASIMASQEL